MKRFFSFLLASIISLALFTGSFSASALASGADYPFTNSIASNYYSSGFSAMLNQLLRNPTINKNDFFACQIGTHFIFSSVSMLDYNGSYYDGNSPHSVNYVHVTYSGSGVNYPVFSFSSARFPYSGTSSFQLSDFSTFDFSALYDSYSFPANRVYAFRLLNGVWACSEDGVLTWNTCDSVYYNYDLSPTPVPPSVTDILYYSKTLNIKAGFSDWLVETERIYQYTQIFGSVASQNIRRVVEFYSNYGGSALSFIFNFPSLANDISITSFTVDSIKELLSLLNYHYQEYLNYLSVRPTDIVKALQPYVSSSPPEPEEIAPEVIQPSDNSDTVLLKKILWYESLILSSINNNADRIINSLDSISFDSNVDFSPLLSFSGVVNKPYYQEFQSNIDRLGCYDFSSASVASASVASASDNKSVPEVFQYSFFDDVEEAEDLTISFDMPNDFFVYKKVNGNFEYSTQMKTFYF